jgi:iron complex transport system ATP-binding protein
MLIAKHLRVALGHTEILPGIDFAARPGEVTAIVGPNGSGKTTLLRALTGDVPYSGTVTLNGRDCARLSPGELASLRAVLPQASALTFPFTVQEVVRLGLSAGIHAARSILPARALAEVGLSGFEGRLYQELSGGQQARVQLARVLVQVWEPVVAGQPRWLFLDEPVAALDIAHQGAVMALVRRFARAGGGVVAVMHDLNLTAAFSDCVVLMRSGQVLAKGGPADVMTDAHLSLAYDCKVAVGRVPPDGVPFILPQAPRIA